MWNKDNLITWANVRYTLLFGECKLNYGKQRYTLLFGM